MRFEVGGAWRWTVGIAEKPLRHQRRKVNGLCDPEARSITLCPTLEPGRRLAVLLHELWHAWTLTFSGAPRDDEGLADFVAAYYLATSRWMGINGGPTALLRLQPGERLSPGAAKIMLRTARTCSTCGQTVAPGSVDATADGEGNVRMALWCGSCEHLQTWQEVADVHGNPCGQTVGAPSHARSGDAVKAYLAAHPEMGVAVL